MMLWIVLGVFAFFAIVLIFWAISIYNRLVTLKNQVDNGFAQIEVMLKRRHDLIPNLVKCVKGYMGHEKTTFMDVVEKRNSAMNCLKGADPTDAQAMQQLASAEGALGGALGRLFALSEDYPELKASKNMQDLQKELGKTEDKVAFTRQAFNNAVTSYNTYKQTFPPVLFASTFGHARDACLLDFDDDEINEVPEVSFA